MLPMNQAQTAVAGPPDDIGDPKVAGTEPSTPRMEMAYETVDHLEKCLWSTCGQWVRWEFELNPATCHTYRSISNADKKTVVVVCNGRHSGGLVVLARVCCPGRLR